MKSVDFDSIYKAFQEEKESERRRLGRAMHSITNAIKNHYEARIEYLKQKARRTIDTAYNRALDDASLILKLTPDQAAELVKLKRTIREITAEKPKELMR